MRTKLMFLLTCTLLLCSCESLFESNKVKLDKLVAAHWKDTVIHTTHLITHCSS